MNSMHYIGFDIHAEGSVSAGAHCTAPCLSLCLQKKQNRPPGSPLA